MDGKTIELEGKKLRVHIDRQFNRVRISMNDLEQAVEYAKAFDHKQDKTIQRALITSAIVSYARPFSYNDAHAKATAQQPSLKGLTKEEKILHKKLCVIRDQAIAHSDYKMNPTSPVEYRQTGWTGWSRLYDPLQEAVNMSAILALAEKVKAQVQSKLFELSGQGSRHV